MVVPILKDGEKSMPSNRSISLLPIVSKIFDRHIHSSKIMLHLQGSYPISDKQLGFCAKESMVHALLSAMDDWLESLETGADVGAVFFDLINGAFDTVPQRALLENLTSVGLILLKMGCSKTLVGHYALLVIKSNL